MWNKIRELWSAVTAETRTTVFQLAGFGLAAYGISRFNLAVALIISGVAIVAVPELRGWITAKMERQQQPRPVAPPRKPVVFG